MATGSNQGDRSHEAIGGRRPLVGVALVALILTGAVIYLIALFVADSIDNSKWSWWLFSHEFKDPSAWYEVARSTVAFTASLGIGLGLVIAYRRQDVSETRERFDAANEEYRRASELYDSAVNQLGHESPTVRLAAMYTLDRPGSAHLEFRQNVVDVWCAYLRVGIEANLRDVVTDGKVVKPSTDAEQEVRNAAQRMLVSHLEMPSSRSWVGSPISPVRIDIDLRGAVLSGFDCEEATFTGDARFDAATFSGNASFAAATFSAYANFRGATFSGTAYFRKATFWGRADFNGATFSGGAYFNGATFSGNVNFRGAKFSRNADFREATFGDGAWFGKATFGDRAMFGRATFRGPIPPQLSELVDPEVRGNNDDKNDDASDSEPENPEDST